MRVYSIIVTSVLTLLAVSACAFLVARKYGIGVELTRNADANKRSRELRAYETLQRLAADPKLTVVRQPSPQDLAGGKKPVVICVVSRNILVTLVKTSDSSKLPAQQPLIVRLETVDVEPVAYDKAELSELIAEIAAVRGESSSSNLTGDLSKLLGSLEKENDQGSGIIFY